MPKKWARRVDDQVRTAYPVLLRTRAISIKETALFLTKTACVMLFWDNSDQNIAHVLAWFKPAYRSAPICSVARHLQPSGCVTSLGAEVFQGLRTWPRPRTGGDRAVLPAEQLAQPARPGYG